MTRDALLGGPPAESGAHCCLCGCWTAAPVVIGYGSQSGANFVTHRVCPRHVHTTGPCTANHDTDG
ncbi:hypothetical protein ACFWIA_11960 [Streptomyces sp. NPDC127068]|uniref:hypothetical protein n=1 Tax=Streptomyces sp. NPDC127068 TaxID=3347127 RepID=UPI00365C839F